MTSLISSIKDVTAKIVLQSGISGKECERRESRLINPRNKSTGRAMIFDEGEDLCGHVSIGVRPGTSLAHNGLFVEMVGQISYRKKRTDDYSSSPHFFLMQRREVSPPGQITQNQLYKFSFTGMEFPYESYFGTLIRVRYFLRLVCESSTSSTSGLFKVPGPSIPTANETEFIIHKYATRVSCDHLEPLKMEVGIEDCLHIEFEYNRGIYTLNDVIEGQIMFFLARLRVRHMEIDLVCIESVLSSDGTVSVNDTEVVTRFELMDGVPPRHTEVPVRLFLSGHNTSPSLENIANRFSVKYYLNLVLVDEEDRRYFKKQEIQLVRSKCSDSKSEEETSGATTSMTSRPNRVVDVKSLQHGFVKQ